MAKNHIITGIDIGSAFIKALTVAKRPNQPDFEILSKIKEPVIGVRKGVVVDIEGLSKKIYSVLQKIQELTGQKIDNVFVNIGGSHLFAISSRGSVAVSRADQKISQEDIERVIQNAQAISLPSNKEILDVFPVEFIVDGAGGIRDALGMQGVRLETNVVNICAFSPYLKNLVNTVLKAGVRDVNVIPSPLASAKAVLNSRQKELGVAVIDIGAGTADLAVFEEGEMIHAAVFPVGSSNITSDIAIGLRCDIDMAEKIKREYGACVYRSRGAGKKYEIPLDGSPPSKRVKGKQENALVFSQKMLTSIIEARVSEIFDLVDKELKKISKSGMLPAGVVLTGGGSKISRIVELARRELRLPIQLGSVQRVIGIDDDFSWSTSCGLALYGHSDDEDNSFSGNEIFSRCIIWLKRFFKTFIP